MSVYLKVLPAVLLDPEVLLELGQKICTIVRESLILDRRMEEICTALEREGRTLKEVIARNICSPYTADLDDAAIACEKACSLLKAGIQLNVLHHNQEYRMPAQRLLHSIDNQGKYIQKTGYDISNDRIRDIIVNLESPKMQQALVSLKLHELFNDLIEAYNRFESIKLENGVISKEEQMPTLRSTIALYGMLIDTLIANVRFENYQLLHRVESVLTKIETAVAEAMEINITRQKSETDFLKQPIAESAIA
jgi:hypothetical protein